MKYCNLNIITNSFVRNRFILNLVSTGFEELVQAMIQDMKREHLTEMVMRVLFFNHDSSLIFANEILESRYGPNSLVL